MFVKTKVGLTTHRLGYSDKLKQIMANSLMGDDASLHNFPYRSSLGKLATTTAIAHRHYRELENPKNVTGLQFRALYWQDVEVLACVGYIGFSRWPAPMLHTFAIARAWRTDKVKDAFLGLLDKQFDGKPYGIMLPAINIRAIRFFEMHGFRQVDRSKRLNTVMLCRA
jgi:hypothetical protein